MNAELAKQQPAKRLRGSFAVVDVLFLLAIGAAGWGLSLASYRFFAHRNNWPLGVLHADLPIIPILLGLFAVVAAGVYAFDRGIDTGGGIIILFGLLLWLFWTGFLRVGSQISLFLAPIAAALLLIGWLGGFTDPNSFERRAQVHTTDTLVRTFTP